jgi:hypothetical protein
MRRVQPHQCRGGEGLSSCSQHARRRPSAGCTAHPSPMMACSALWGSAPAVRSPERARASEGRALARACIACRCGTVCAAAGSVRGQKRGRGRAELGTWPGAFWPHGAWERGGRGVSTVGASSRCSAAMACAAAGDAAGLLGDRWTTGWHGTARDVGKDPACNCPSVGRPATRATCGACRALLPGVRAMACAAVCPVFCARDGRAEQSRAGQTEQGRADRAGQGRQSRAGQTEQGRADRADRAERAEQRAAEGTRRRWPVSGRGQPGVAGPAHGAASHGAHASVHGTPETAHGTPGTVHGTPGTAHGTQTRRMLRALARA